MKTQIGIALMAFNFICVFVYIVALKRIFWLLKHRHHQFWLEMGTPSLIWNYSLKTLWTIITMIASRKLEPLEDRRLTKTLLAARISFAGVLLASTLLAVLTDY